MDKQNKALFIWFPLFFDSPNILDDKILHSTLQIINQSTWHLSFSTYRSAEVVIWNTVWVVDYVKHVWSLRLTVTDIHVLLALSRKQFERSRSVKSMIFLAIACQYSMQITSLAFFLVDGNS